MFLIRGVLAGAFVTGLAVLVPLPSAESGSARTVIDRNEVFQQLSDYQASRPEHRLVYRQLTVLTSDAEWMLLREMLMSSQAGGSPLVSESAEAWALKSTHAARGCWEAVSASRPGAWKLDRSRVPGCDTTEAFLESEAIRYAGSPEVVNPVGEQSILVAGELRAVVENRRSVKWSRVSHDPWPLFPIDPRLSDWQSALTSPEVSGQTITAWREGKTTMLEYVNRDDDGVIARAEYVFDVDANDELVPLRITAWNENTITSDSVYGYVRRMTGNDRPSVAAHAQPARDGQVRVVMHVVRSWSDSTTDDDYAQYLPAARFEISYLNDSQPTMKYVVPDYLENVPWDQRSGIAAVHVLQHWGRRFPDADFTADGVVDQADLLHALNHLPR